MTHDESHNEMLALEPLGVLDQSEVNTLNQHLAGCMECQMEHVEWQDAAALLAFAVPLQQPSERVRSEILQTISLEHTAGNVLEHTSSKKPVPRSKSSLFSTQNLLRLAAAVALIALFIGLVALWRRDIRQRNELARLSRELNLERQTLMQEREAVAHGRDVIALLTAPDTKKAQLSGTEVATNARATLAFDRQTGSAVLVAEGLPPTPVDKAYELWFIVNGKPLPGNVFHVDASGRAIVSHQVPATARERSVFAITLEPKGGVSSPTGKIYLASPAS